MSSDRILEAVAKLIEEGLEVTTPWGTFELRRASGRGAPSAPPAPPRPPPARPSRAPETPAGAPQRKRRSHSRQFKREAVALAAQVGVNEAARQLGVAQSGISTWKKKPELQGGRRKRKAGSLPWPHSKVPEHVMAAMMPLAAAGGAFASVEEFARLRWPEMSPERMLGKAADLVDYLEGLGVLERDPDHPETYHLTTACERYVPIERKPHDAEDGDP